MITVEVLQMVALWSQIGSELEPRRTGHYVLMLLDQVNERILPIWIGEYEYAQLDIILRESSADASSISNRNLNLIVAAGASVHHVEITELINEKFGAVIWLKGGAFTWRQLVPGGNMRKVEARPSDAIILALVAKAPIQVTEAVMLPHALRMGTQFRSKIAEMRRMARQSDLPEQDCPKLVTVLSPYDHSYTQICQMIKA